jgi:hypothetical protein
MTIMVDMMGIQVVMEAVAIVEEVMVEGEMEAVANEEIVARSFGGKFKE